jgi:PEP-CTERM motif
VIGVSARQADLTIAAGFFELFKTPWEPATPGRRYTAIISTDGRHNVAVDRQPETVARQIIRFRHGRRDRVRSREYVVHSTLSTFARIDGAFQDSARARADFFDTVDGDHRGLTVGVAASPIPEVPVPEPATIWMLGMGGVVSRAVAWRTRLAKPTT